ncbi:MAG: alpha/beta hydrolase-fold protein [Corynebacterium sp.]|nr:alpha/beta hydrolase-fold protein [Corynebacterium sp.]
MAQFYQWLNIPITNALAIGLFFAVLVGVAVWLAWRRPRRIIIVAVIISVVFTGVFWLLYDVIIIPYMEKLMPILYPGIALLAFIMPLSFTKRGIVAIIAVILPTMGLTNAAYDQYPTLASLLPSRNVAPMTYQEFQAQKTAPTMDGQPVGALVSVDLPASKSNFPARTSLAYIPPAYWSGAKLPVIVMMAGNPGSPGQWFGPLNAQEPLQHLQAANHGVAPIVFSIDATASTSGNPLCIDGPEYNVHTWLAQDVPAGIKHMFTVDTDQNHWSIGGLSYGGTCALQVITNSPTSYGTFISYAGQGEPIYKDHATTLKMFFHNDEAAFQAVNPMNLLEHPTPQYRQLAGWFIAGDADPKSQQGLQELNQLAQHAGIDSRYTEIPGSHTARVWRTGFGETLMFAAERGGLTGLTGVTSATGLTAAKG